MKTTIKTKAAGEIQINSTFLGSKAWSTDRKDTGFTNYNNHRIQVKTNGKSLTFEFWGSIVKPEIQTDEENIFALYCFLSDSISGSQSFEEFCGEFGHDTDSRKAEKTHKACSRSFDKYERVFQADIYDLINEIQETHNL